jgi:hypothetical protein
MERGKPSIRYGPLRERMAFLSKSIVTCAGTILPSLIISLMVTPSAEPLATSSRSKSPAEKCAYPKWRVSRSHCVPLPEPGPPSTNTTSFALSGGSAGVEPTPNLAHAAATAPAASSSSTLKSSRPDTR